MGGKGTVEVNGSAGELTAEVRDWASKGDSLVTERRFEEAVKCFDCALELSPGDPGLWVARGRALSAGARQQEALACYDKALAIDPDYLLAWAGKARTLRDLGDGKQAAACLDNWRRLSRK